MWGWEWLHSLGLSMKNSICILKYMCVNRERNMLAYMFTQILHGIVMGSYCREENVHSFLVLVHFNVKNKPRKMCILHYDVTPPSSTLYSCILLVDIIVIIHLFVVLAATYVWHCSLNYADEKFTFNKDEREEVRVKFMHSNGVEYVKSEN